MNGKPSQTAVLTSDKQKQQLRLSKIKSKRAQLDNLLRKRERIDFEVTRLKKSIARDQKQAVKEQLLARDLHDNHPETFLEALGPSSSEEESKDKTEQYSIYLEALQVEFANILLVLTNFAETLD